MYDEIEGDEEQTPQDIVVEMVTGKFPDAEYLGCGADGCVFDLNGHHVLKVGYREVPSYYPENIEGDVLCFLAQAGAPGVPAMYAYGTLDGHKAFIRENLSDAYEDDMDTKDLESIWDDLLKCRENVENEEDSSRLTSIFGLDTDEDERDYINPLVAPEFLLELSRLGAILKKSHIEPNDISVRNMGLDMLGNAKIRDASRFFPMFGENLGFFKDHDISETVEALIQDHKAVSPMFSVSTLSTPVLDKRTPDILSR